MRIHTHTYTNLRICIYTYTHVQVCENCHIYLVMEVISRMEGYTTLHVIIFICTLQDHLRLFNSIIISFRLCKYAYGFFLYDFLLYCDLTQLV